MDRSAAVTKTLATLDKTGIQLVSVLDEFEQDISLHDNNTLGFKIKIGKLTTNLNLPDVNLHITNKDENDSLSYVYWKLEPKLFQHLFPEIR